MAHANIDIPELATTIVSIPMEIIGNASCLNCASPVNINNGSGYVIPCRAHHVYCFLCLRRSMNEFLASFSTPVCHSRFCDYQLSRHDLCCIPLERSSFRRLVALVKTERRPKCSKCRFYIDLSNMSDLDQHMEMCSPENMIPCECCFCPQEITNFEEHLRQCQNDQIRQEENFIHFIQSHSEYPFTTNQIKFLIKLQRQNNLSVDPLTIIEILAGFEGVIPFEIHTYDCGICLESYLYDDIFVFGCDSSHKLCYKCYEQSCTTKMNNNEILTCSLCSYPLSYGELRQLRVSPVQRDLFIDYQTQKTFDRYTGHTQGIIKCPNRNCTWAVETNDPTERIRVICQICAKEFCSLCNQQYHYRTSCQQVTEITQQWFVWCDSERGRYLIEQARINPAYATRLVEYERQQPENNERNEELRLRYRETMADETYKAEHCRLCPHCGRVVEHVGGCSSMICGQDYHGGNAQSGCGHHFTWNEARPYVATVIRELSELRHQMPQLNTQNIVHENIICAGCHEIVRGIRFECIHCTWLNYCENCEQLYTLIHSNINRQDGQPQHVFRLIITPLNQIF